MSAAGRYIKAFLLLIVIAGYAVPPAHPAETVVRVGYLQNDLHHLPLFVAKEKGLFDRQGCDIRIGGIFKAGPELMSAFASGALDIGYVGVAPAVVAALNAKADVSILAQANLEGSGLVVRKDSDVRSLSDLVGGTVAVPGYGQVQDLLFRKALANNKLSPSDFRILIIKPPEMIAALQARQIDAMVAWEPHITFAVTRGAGRRLLDSKDIWPGHPCCVLVVNKTFKQTHPETVQSFVRAHVDAYNFIMDHPDEAVGLGAAFTGMDAETVRQAISHIIYEVIPDRGGILEYVRFLQDSKIVSAQIDSTRFVDELIDPVYLTTALSTPCCK